MRMRINIVKMLLVALTLAGLGHQSNESEYEAAANLVLNARPSLQDESARTLKPVTVATNRRATPRRVRASACPPSHPYQLVVSAETIAELPYVDQIDACTNWLGSQTWLRNRSSVVWKPFVAGGGTTSELSAAAKAVKAAVGYQYAIIVPDAAVTIYAAPRRVTWKFDVGISAAWEAREYLYEWAISNGLASAFAFNYRGTRVGAAVATCLLAVNTAVVFRQSLIADGSARASSIIRGVLSTGVGAATCAQRLRTIAYDYRVHVPNFTNGLTASEFRYLRVADDLMTRMQRAQRWAQLLVLHLT